MAGSLSASNVSLSSAMGVAPSSNPDLGEQDEENHLQGAYSTPVRPFSRSNDSGIAESLLSEQRGEQLSDGVSCQSMHTRIVHINISNGFGVIGVVVSAQSSLGSQQPVV